MERQLDTRGKIMAIAARLALREGIVTLDDLPASRADIWRALEVQDRVVAEMAAELGRLARLL